MTSMTMKVDQIVLISSDKRYSTKTIETNFKNEDWGLLVDLFCLFYPRLHFTSSPLAEKMNIYILLCRLSVFLT